MPFYPNKCVTDACEGCLGPVIGDEEVEKDLMKVTNVAAQEFTDLNLENPTAAEIVDIADKVTKRYNVQHFRGAVTGNLGLIATGHCNE